MVEAHLEQRYVSRELTHFVGSACCSDEERYALLTKILTEGCLRHPDLPSRTDRDVNVRIAHVDFEPRDLASSNKAFWGTFVCFCDIPLADLPLHMAKYGPCQGQLTFPQNGQDTSPQIKCSSG
jgi:hypothetical protein